MLYLVVSKWMQSRGTEELHNIVHLGSQEEF
jgi:hypothetical protein